MTLNDFMGLLDIGEERETMTLSDFLDMLELYTTTKKKEVEQAVKSLSFKEYVMLQGRQ